MSKKISLLDELQNQKDNEIKAKELMLLDAEKVENIIVNSFLKRIAQDCQRHADTYDLLIEITKGVEATKKPEKEEIKNAIKRHVAIEINMIERIKHLLKIAKSPRTQTMLKGLQREEENHHKALSALHKTLTEEASLEDGYWKYGLVSF